MSSATAQRSAPREAESEANPRNRPRVVLQSAADVARMQTVLARHSDRFAILVDRIRTGKIDEVRVNGHREFTRALNAVASYLGYLEASVSRQEVGVRESDSPRAPHQPGTR